MILTRRNLILAATAGIFVPKYGRWFNRLREPKPEDYSTWTLRMREGRSFEVRWEGGRASRHRELVVRTIPGAAEGSLILDGVRVDRGFVLDVPRDPIILPSFSSAEWSFS